MRPDVSILMPTMDRPDRLERAVAAILEQEGPTFELIVNNGGGSINLPADSRIRLLGRTTPISGVLNDTAQYARGDIMCISADDDVMQPGTLADVVETFAETGCLWTYGRMQHVHDGVLGQLDGGIEWDYSLMRCGNIVCCPTVFWSRQIWDELGPFDESLNVIADYEMWCRFGMKYEPAVRQHLDYHYEVWDGSSTAKTMQEHKDELWRLRARWERIGFGNREPNCYLCGEPAIGVSRRHGKVVERAVCREHANEKQLGAKIDFRVFA